MSQSCTKHHVVQFNFGVLLDDRDTLRRASTLSVWESGKSLESFVHKTVHGNFVKRGDNWFEKHKGPSYVIWSIKAGITPTIKEAVERLEMLGVNGPTKLAYDFDWMRVNADRAEV